jgi:protein SCO1/2
MHVKMLWLTGGAVGIIAALSAILFITAKPALHGAVISPAAPATEIQLRDFNAHPFTLSALRGKVVVLYFGYTNCQTECPLTMAHLKLATQLVGTRSNEITVVMISTDPVRDTPAAMRDFLGRFDSRFVGLVGTADELRQVWKDYGVAVEDGGETHSYFIYVIDPSGKFRETFLPDSSPADISADATMLLQGK